MKHVRIVIEGDFDEDGLTVPEDGVDFEQAMQRLVDDIQYDVEADWPGKNFKISYEIEADPVPPKSKTPGHLVTMVVTADEGWQPWCSCGWKLGLDGVGGKVGFKSDALAARLGDKHLWDVEQELKGDKK
jgi:hypothetical protein